MDPLVARLMPQYRFLHGLVSVPTENWLVEDTFTYMMAPEQVQANRLRSSSPTRTSGGPISLW
jgi:hypothetical protein